MFSVRLINPFGVADFHHHAGALVEPDVIGGGHVDVVPATTRTSAVQRAPSGGATACSIEPKIDLPASSSISILTVSPYFMNSVCGAPCSIVSRQRSSAMQQ